MALLAAACLCACAPLPRYETRPARSSLGCMQAALAGHEPLPADDAQAHCLAAGAIARHCSIIEAWLASLGKEVLDLLGPGDAEWRDLANDRRGIDCARRSQDAASLEVCCRAAPTLPNPARDQGAGTGL